MQVRRRVALLWVLVLASAYTLFSLFVAIVSAEITVHLPKRPIHHRDEFADHIRQRFHAELRDVAIRVADGTLLRGWYVEPQQFNGNYVILLHGVTDNREGMAGFSEMFLSNGYGVLLPDSRSHGESEGGLATYGVLERDDVRLWAQWLNAKQPGHCTYLFGESMGAAIAVQSIAVTKGVCAAVVESPYSTFRAIAGDRFARHTGLPDWAAKGLFAPAIEIALTYTRWRYNVDLSGADPSLTITQSQVPVLIIAGTKDRNIPMRHGEALSTKAPSHTTLWIVQGADHGNAINIEPQEFETRVLGWLTSHRT